MLSQRELKGIKLVQDRSDAIQMSHDGIGSSLEEIKRQLMAQDGVAEFQRSEEYTILKRQRASQMGVVVPLERTSLDVIFAEAEAKHANPLTLSDILTAQDFEVIDGRISKHLQDFNAKYALDGWDYAIAGGCGLFAAMLDLLCVNAPPKPTAKWLAKVDGVFNKGVKAAFDKLIPPELSDLLCHKFPIASPDSSCISDLVNAPAKALNPMNHRLRALSHDPILGFIFGVLDMCRGTCTTVVGGQIVTIESLKGASSGSVFQMLGRMLGHLLSDINAPTANANRGMGLPAPFMGLLGMFKNIPVGNSTFDRQIEWMYVNGYDFRQFVVTSVPMAIMEVMMRAFYVAKQMSEYDAPFGETVMDTMPTRLNPRFRMMLALAYGTSSAVNAGKMYVTQNILNASYASWMGLAWNGFHALKWALYSKHMAFWSQVEDSEIAALEKTVLNIEALEGRAEQLPV